MKNEKISKSKNSKGITLIALVVTIVVLLILVAISVNLTLGDNGIFSKASNAKDEYEVAQIKEEAEQVKVGLKIDELTNSAQERLNKSKLLLALQNHFVGSTLENGNVVVKEGKYAIAVVGDNLEIVVTKHKELKKGEIEIVYDYNAEGLNDELEILVSVNVGGFKTYEQYVQEILDKLPSVETEEGMMAREQLFMESYLYMAELEGAEQLEDMRSAQTFSEFAYCLFGLKNINSLSDLLEIYNSYKDFKSIDEMLILMQVIDIEGYMEYYQENTIGEIEMILPNGNSENIFPGAYISYDVYENGTYTFKAIGENGKNVTKEIKIEIPASSIQLNEQAVIGVGDTRTLNVTLLPSFVNSTKITWTSSDKSVAKVNNGEVTGINVGNAIITAEIENGQKATCNIVVKQELFGLERLVGNAALSETQTVNDEFGNQVVIPKNFKVAQDSGTTVQQGIVVEDSIGNQYVWVPVSNIDASGSNKIVLDNGDEVEITLGRYDFDAVFRDNRTPTGTGVATLQQKGSEWAQEKGASYKELKDSRISDGTNGINTTAKDLQGFIESVRDNHGYYIARYEASQENRNSTERLASIKNKKTWKVIQRNAAAICKNMYKETDDDIECDLINSYAWDTAIVYIQKCGEDGEAYSKANRGENTSEVSTGMSGDEKCKINDMAKNVEEWTTEYSNFGGNRNMPCVLRGGSYKEVDGFTSLRLTSFMNYDEATFRPVLYIAP